jgi:hypothetical protein
MPGTVELFISHARSGVIGRVQSAGGEKVRFIFCDEQKLGSGSDSFVAVVACSIHDSVMMKVRDRVFHVIRSVLKCREGEVQELPIIHGSDMLRGFEDSKKVSLFQEFCKIYQEFGIDVFRIGYYCDTARIVGGAHGASITAISYPVCSHYNEPLVWIYEYAKSEHKAISQHWNDQSTQFYGFQIGIVFFQPQIMKTLLENTMRTSATSISTLRMSQAI